jgi:hypothetical protein
MLTGELQVVGFPNLFVIDDLVLGESLRKRKLLQTGAQPFLLLLFARAL